MRNQEFECSMLLGDVFLEVVVKNNSSLVFYTGLKLGV